MDDPRLEEPGVRLERVRMHASPARTMVAEMMILAGEAAAAIGARAPHPRAHAPDIFAAGFGHTEACNSFVDAVRPLLAAKAFTLLAWSHACREESPLRNQLAPYSISYHGTAGGNTDMAVEWGVSLSHE